jgi:hypothetical protein
MEGNKLHMVLIVFGFSIAFKRNINDSSLNYYSVVGKPPVVLIVWRVARGGATVKEAGRSLFSCFSASIFTKHSSYIFAPGR